MDVDRPESSEGALTPRPQAVPDVVESVVEAPEPLRVGATLARALSFYGRHLPALALVSAAAFLPLALYQLHFARRIWEGDGFGGSVLESLVLLGLYFLVPLLLQVFVTLAVFQHLRGDRPSMLRSVGRGLLALPPALGLALLFLLILVGVLLATAIPVGMISDTFRESEAAGSLGGIVFLLAVAWVFCVYFVAPQALTVERLYPWTALGRSTRLTRGSRWRIFAIVLLLVVLLWLVGRGLDLVLPDVAWSWSDMRLRVLAYSAAIALFSAFAAVCAAVAYHDLRRAKDGVGLDELLQVFE